VEHSVPYLVEPVEACGGALAKPRFIVHVVADGAHGGHATKGV